MSPVTQAYKLFSDPWKFYNAMLEDIEQASDYIYIETYKFGSGNIGVRFRDVLTRKAREGVKIKLLMDSWGTSVSYSFFSEMISHGAEVRFFKKIKFFIDFFTKNHRRNHRKLMIIDDRITYLGSANIAGHSLNWRESMLRIDGNLTGAFKNVFLEDFRLYKRYVYKKPDFTRLIKQNGFEILRDVPSITRQRIKRRYERIFKNANNKVYIETPYFLPSYLLRKAMTDAAARGVEVNILLPKHSDIGLVDVIRNRYIGYLYKHNVKIWYYMPHNLHSKLILADDTIFCIGSANFDYRSFRYQHELMLLGDEPKIADQVKQHIDTTLVNCEPFNYKEWKRRPFVQKCLEWIFMPFRYLL
jgi:cardiolipin synthase